MLPRIILLFTFFLIISIDGNHRDTTKRKHFLRFLQSFRDRFHGSLDRSRFDKESMLLFPHVAFQTVQDPNLWKIAVHGWRFEGSRKNDLLGFRASRWIQRIASNLVDSDDILYLNGSINRDRLRPFFFENEANERIEISLGDRTQEVRTDRQGLFYDEIEATNQEVQQWKNAQKLKNRLIYEAIGDNGDKSEGIIHLIEPPQGISVVSDIDDTIKISEVLDKVRLLANTFIHPFKAVPGMAELYQQWLSKHPNCSFHYLSGMPDQLYTMTQDFIESHKFPDGSFHMRHFGWAASSLFDFLHSESTKNHKLSHLRFLISNTVRDYVLVGDSGEKDPEIYGIIAREFPERIRAIFIRAIKGESLDSQRFLDAFQGVAPQKWQIFTNPEQVPKDLTNSPRSKMI